MAMVEVARVGAGRRSERGGGLSARVTATMAAARVGGIRARVAAGKATVVRARVGEGEATAARAGAAIVGMARDAAVAGKMVAEESLAGSAATKTTHLQPRSAYAHQWNLRQRRQRKLGGSRTALRNFLGRIRPQMCRPRSGALPGGPSSSRADCRFERGSRATSELRLCRLGSVWTATDPSGCPYGRRS